MSHGWRRHGACTPDDDWLLFAAEEAYRKKGAKRVCGPCPVRTECLAEALDNQIPAGVWGGMTTRQRRELLREHPDVVSWRVLFDETRHARTAKT
ncbi:WhiB family transcriptional regulator [Actinorugispora endophytica]|uniref:Transcriptional regulator WhiB n=1 Tax=Actinorugispora endophytica TaxID=1605990 RepID=A0A4R6VCB2_9ACTN|nr:WhiB family transcriptional regulator [Actinorugispora endophytica]TDQ54396.1 WhiB family redox-sensing transcriptional regulator [Actinorugispora endophytica]